MPPRRKPWSSPTAFPAGSRSRTCLTARRCTSPTCSPERSPDVGSDPFFHWYVGIWGFVCAVAHAMVLSDPKAYSFTERAYFRYLGVPWKLATFAVAGIGMTVVAPHTGDPTWDYYDAAVMSALTFLTAPWSTGTLYLALRGKAGLRQACVAACL